MDRELDFARRVIKGKITELVFELMFRSVGKYTVIPFGYELTQPVLAQHLSLLAEQDVLDTLRHTPDFILVSSDKKKVYFVEVKYRQTIDRAEIKEVAQAVVGKWNQSFLFVATPQGFFYAPCNTIINDDGRVGELHESTVPKDVQKKFLHLLNEFER